MPKRNDLQIELILNDKASAGLRQAESNIKGFARKTKVDFVDLAAKAFVAQQALEGIVRVASHFVSAASKVEQLTVRLETLLGSVEEGNRLFDEMSDLAGRVPQTFDQIMEAATQLSGVVRGGVDEVAQLMPVILDLSAATGIGVQETTSQLIRMYSAGAASADLFRERGVLAMLGFQAGVSVSAEETMERVIAAWEDGESKFRGATEKLSETWSGEVSMMEDAWFKFRVEVGKFITESKEVADGMTVIIDKINLMTEVVGRFKFVSGTIKDTFTGGVSPFEAMLRNVDEWLQLSTNIKNAQIEAVQLAEVVVEANRETGKAVNSTSESVENLKKEFRDFIEKELSNLPNMAEASFSAMKKSIDALAQGTGTAFSSMLVHGESFTKGMETAIKSMAEVFIQEVTRMIAKWLAFKALGSFFGGGAGGFLGGFFAEGGEVGSQGKRIPLPQFAEGGMVAGGRAVPVIAHEGEIIGTPSRLAAAGVGAKTFNIVINNPQFKDDGQIDYIVEEVGRRVEASFRTARGF